MVAQILNVDRTAGNDTTPKRVHAVIALTASADKQKKDLVDLSTSADLTSRFSNNVVGVLKLSTDLTTNGEEVIQNAGFMHIRFRDDNTRKLYPETFGQYQWNGVLGMEQRILGGVNLRWLAADKESNNMVVGIGLMYEHEKWNFNGVPDIQNADTLPVQTVDNLRVNQYVKWSYRLGTNADFVLANFIQCVADDFSKTRIASNVAINFRFFKWLGFSVNYDSVYDFKPVVPISKYYYALKGQLNFEF
ncbi:MAG: DUF481 domain-containing protein [Bacteroidota bacterium]